MRTADTQNRTTTVWTATAVALRRCCFAALAMMVALATLTTSALEAHAAIVMVDPDDVNRLNEFSPDATDDLFSTRQQPIDPDPDNDQYTIVTTLQSTFLTALQTAFPGATNFKINSATLTVGDALDEYETASKAHVMKTTYSVGDASYNNSNETAGTLWGGGTLDEVGGTDWETAVQATGVIGADITTFDLTAYVQGVLDGTYTGAGEGLFFENLGGGAGPSTFETLGENVEWTLDAVAIPTPEPSTLTLMLAGLTSLCLCGRRRRKR